MNKENNQLCNLSYIFKNDIEEIDSDSIKNNEKKDFLNNDQLKYTGNANSTNTHSQYNNMNYNYGYNTNSGFLSLPDKNRIINQFPDNKNNNNTIPSWTSNNSTKHRNFSFPNTIQQSNNLPLSNNTYHQSVTKSQYKSQSQSQTICKFFLTNSCTKGNKCTYSHDMKGLPCKFFHALGYCDKGNECNFSHSRLSTEKEVFSFIENNTDFINELIRKIGRTNIDEFYYEYMKINQKHYMNSIIPDEYDRSMSIGMTGKNNINNMSNEKTNTNMNIIINTNTSIENINDEENKIKIDNRKLIPNGNINPFEMNY